MKTFIYIIDILKPIIFSAVLFTYANLFSNLRNF